MKAKAPTIWELEAEGEYLSPQVMRALVVGGLVVLYAVALLLVARRMMGALTEELAGPVVVATALLSFALVSGLRVLWWRTFSEPEIVDSLSPNLSPNPSPEYRGGGFQKAWIGWGASLTLVLIVGAISFPRGGSQQWMIWLPVLAADQWLRWRMFAEKPPAEQMGAKAIQLQTAGDAWQQVVRTRDVAGVETVTAALRADFVEGQRSATVYVGFCPPLNRVPEISLAPLEGAEAKIVQAFPHGARIDVRLAQAAREAMSVSLNVVARG
jgi:hypothetical protein